MEFVSSWLHPRKIWGLRKTRRGSGQTIGAPGLSPTIGPDYASLIGAPNAVQSWSQGSVPPLGFSGQNVSQGVPNGSFGSGITPSMSINPYGFSGGDFGAGIGAGPQGLGGSYAVGSAVSNMGMDLPSGPGINDYSFGGNTDVSGFDANQGGGSPPAQDAPPPPAYGDGGGIQGRNSQLSQNAFIAGEWKKAADRTAAANLLGQQITNVAPGNQTNYALGAINPMATPQIQHTPFTPVNMGGVFAPLATAAFMPRFTF